MLPSGNIEQVRLVKTKSLSPNGNSSLRCGVLASRWLGSVKNGRFVNHGLSKRGKLKPASAPSAFKPRGVGWGCVAPAHWPGYNDGHHVHHHYHQNQHHHDQQQRHQYHHGRRLRRQHHHARDRRRSGDSRPCVLLVPVAASGCLGPRSRSRCPYRLCTRRRSTPFDRCHCTAGRFLRRSRADRIPPPSSATLLANLCKRRRIHRAREGQHHCNADNPPRRSRRVCTSFSCRA